jgi:hypothetical protein
MTNIHIRNVLSDVIDRAAGAILTTMGDCPPVLGARPPPRRRPLARRIHDPSPFALSVFVQREGVKYDAVRQVGVKAYLAVGLHRSPG